VLLLPAFVLVGGDVLVRAELKGILTLVSFA
jgi:hypothetical protein